MFDRSKTRNERRWVAYALLSALVVLVAFSLLVTDSGWAWSHGANAGLLATLYGTVLTILIFQWTRSRNRETADLLASVQEAATGAKATAGAAAQAASDAADAASAAERAAAAAESAAHAARGAAQGAEREASAVSRRLAKLAEQLQLASPAVVRPDPATEAVDLDETLQPPYETRPEELMIVIDGLECRVMEPARVPLRVIWSLVDEWEVRRLPGRYRVSDIDACARATGQGNFPWLVHFASEPSHVWWRVSFGGKSKRIGTVDQIEIG